VRESGVGSTDNTPPEVVAQLGNFPDHSETGAALIVAEEVRDILDHQEGRTFGQPVDELDDRVEQPAVVVGATVTACTGHGLAGPSRREDVGHLQRGRVGQS
jgi:hypothetical protein